MSITTDTEYQDAVKNLLDDLNSRLTDPGWMPISHDEQARFIHQILGRAHEIVNSEPYLRGKVFEAADKLREIDVERVEKDRDLYHEAANYLYDALNGIPAVRLKKDEQRARKEALEAAEKVL